MIEKLIQQLRTNQHYIGASVSVEPPGECTYCPFDAKPREPHDQIANDLSEAHYLCPLLAKEVWGEDPECEKELNGMFINYLRSLV